MLILHKKSIIIGMVLLSLSVFLIIAPFLWVALQSLKYEIEILKGSWFFAPTLSNYWGGVYSRRSDFMSNMANSFIVASISTFFALSIGVLAAYSLSRLTWKKWISSAFLGWILIFNMITPLALVGPWYLIFRHLGLHDTLGGLIATHITLHLPMTIWMMMTYFNDLPKDLEEAAKIDGCREIDTFWRVLLPLVTPGLIAAGVLAFIFSWNEFSVAPNLTGRATATVPVAISRFAQQYEV